MGAIEQQNNLVGIVGAGAMGRGIAQVVSLSGCTVKLFDVNKKASEDAIAFIAQMFSRLEEKGRINANEHQEGIRRLRVVNKIEALDNCDVIIESVTENYLVKKDIFNRLDSIVSKDTILTSNTSSISITKIATNSSYPGRVAGFHFFNPVPLMELVEVVSGLRTETWVIEKLIKLAQVIGKVPIHVRDSPGFVANQIGRGYVVEAANLYNEGVASFSTIDKVMREAADFKMGPFQLMDLTGLNVSHPATQQIYDQSFHEPRFRPSSLMRDRAEAGLMGKKLSNGFYAEPTGEEKKYFNSQDLKYDNRPVWVNPSSNADYQGIRKIFELLGATFDNGDRPSDNSLIIVAPLGSDATTFSHEEKLDLRRTIAIDTLFSLKKRRTVMGTITTDVKYLKSCVGLLSRDNVPVSVIQDSAGFIVQRILSMIINIACSIAESGSASPKDIDEVARLGLGYPFGPLKFGDQIGAGRILQILEAIFKLTGDPRYRPTMWLRRRALSGLSLLYQSN